MPSLAHEGQGNDIVLYGVMRQAERGGDGGYDPKESIWEKTD